MFSSSASGAEPVGASRLTDEYWERQKTLEAAVAEARKRLEEVRGTGR